MPDTQLTSLILLPSIKNSMLMIAQVGEKKRIQIEHA